MHDKIQERFIGFYEKNLNFSFSKQEILFSSEKQKKQNFLFAS